MSTKPVIAYFYRGMIERGNGHGYDWKEGYSADSEDGKPLYPWSTKQECQHEAEDAGAKAAFIHDTAKQLA